MDEELMKRVAKGDNEAFSEIVVRHQMRLQHIAYRFLGKKEDAEDVVQEVFLKLYSHRKKYKNFTKLPSYLSRMTINKCIDKIRSATKIRFCRLDEDVNSPLFFPNEMSEKKELSEFLQEALNELPTRQRVAFLLKTYTDLSYQDIGRSLACSRVAVEGLIFRARQTLQKKLRSRNKKENCLCPVKKTNAVFPHG